MNLTKAEADRLRAVWEDPAVFGFPLLKRTLAGHEEELGTLVRKDKGMAFYFDGTSLVAVGIEGGEAWGVDVTDDLPS